MRPIFCGNFEFDAHQSDLERLFKRYGKVDRVEMKSGFAFVYMDDDRDAEDAIRGLDRKEFGRKGRRLRVEWTKHEQRGGGGGGKKPVGSRRSANVRPSKTLFVINFPYETRTRDLERHFEPYGKLVNVRIRRNFAFVQYEFQEDATKALDATHSSKMLDKVISVEYASRDDDDRRNGHSPDGRRGGGRDRSPNRRRRSPSPYARERGSPDYGRGSSPVPHRRGSPDYGHRPRPSPSPRRGGERGSPDYNRGRSRSPQRGKASYEPGQALSPSPRRKERGSPGYGRALSRSPRRGERANPKYDRERSRSPQRKKASHEYRRASSPSHHGRASPDKGPTLSPSLHGEGTNLDNGQARSPSPLQERTSPDAHARDLSPPKDRTSPPTGVMASPNHRDISLSPPPQEKFANGNGSHRRSASPYPGEEGSPDNGRASSPAEKPELKERSPVEEY